MMELACVPYFWQPLAVFLLSANISGVIAYFGVRALFRR
jgi:hypothetical protein